MIELTRLNQGWYPFRERFAARWKPFVLVFAVVTAVVDHVTTTTFSD